MATFVDQSVGKEIHPAPKKTTRINKMEMSCAVLVKFLSMISASPSPRHTSGSDRKIRG